MLVISPEAYLPLEVNKPPFEFGFIAELPPFTPEEIERLVKFHGLNLSSRELTKLSELSGGLPYLVRRLLYDMTAYNLKLENLLSTVADDTGIFADYLQDLFVTLYKYPNLMAAYQQIVNSTTPIHIPQMEKLALHSLGLVRFLPHNQVTVSCDLYRQYFKNIILGG